MFTPNDYELIDFGDGQKLERLGGVVVRRPSPPAIRNWNDKNRLSQIAIRNCWTYSLSSGQTQKGSWHGDENLPEPWIVQYGDLKFHLKLTPFGHLGIFPEQAINWDWLSKQSLQGSRALNLFAYTGGTSMQLAKLGCEVTHVDSARNVVQWARENAALSGLANAPIRWITEDVLRYLRREAKRGNRYDVVAADPPSFGRGPKNEVWKIERDFSEFLELVFELTNGRPKLLLVSGHSGHFDQFEMKSALEEQFSNRDFHFKSGDMSLKSRDGHALNAGYFVRVSRILKEH